MTVALTVESGQAVVSVLLLVERLTVERLKVERLKVSVEALEPTPAGLSLEPKRLAKF